VIGFSALMLTAQITGIRLTARVDADPTYRQCAQERIACQNTCQAKYTPGSTDYTTCIQQCNAAHAACVAIAGP
jgi:hypothetical protein